jgi:hypothetical protein
MTDKKPTKPGKAQSTDGTPRKLLPIEKIILDEANRKVKIRTGGVE